MVAEKIGLTLLLLSPLPAQPPVQRLAERSVAPVGERADSASCVLSRSLPRLTTSRSWTEFVGRTKFQTQPTKSSVTFPWHEASQAP